MIKLYCNECHRDLTIKAISSQKELIGKVYAYCTTCRLVYETETVDSDKKSLRQVKLRRAHPGNIMDTILVFHHLIDCYMFQIDTLTNVVSRNLTNAAAHWLHVERFEIERKIQRLHKMIKDLRGILE